MFSEFLTIVGLYALLCYLYDNLRTPVYLLYNTWLQRHNTQQIYLMEKYGKWAAVTGSTAGIGKAYARELARLGFNIVLISNIKTKEVAHEIETEFGVKTIPIECDFSKGAKIYNTLLDKLAEQPIGILVNNVGVAPNPLGTTSNFSPELIWNMININIGAATLLRHFINKWHRAGDRGLIVNISSGTAQMPCPFASVYGASKAYINSFTKALQEETKHLGISVQLVAPHFVVTNINSYSKKIMQGNIFVPPPDVFAKWAIGTLGKVDETTGYFWHGVVNTILNIVPYRVKGNIIVSFIRLVCDNLAEAKKL